jgi:cytochrome c-type biogenesis protein CcmH
MLLSARLASALLRVFEKSCPPVEFNARARTVFALVALAGILLALPLTAQQAAEQAGKDAFQRVSDKLICQCGCNYGLSHCPHLECPSAPVLRAAIREKLAAGQSEEQVLQAMVAQFGPAVLAAPPTEGFNLTAWIMPFVALVLGLWLAIVVVRRWHARRHAAAPDPYLLERYRANLEREMKRLEE